MSGAADMFFMRSERQDIRAFLGLPVCARARACEREGAMTGKKDRYGLTAKQAAFATAYATGKTLQEAYAEAYNAGKMKPATMKRRADELLRQPKIAQRVTSLREKVERACEDAAVMNRVEVLEELTRIATGGGLYPAYGAEGEEMSPRPATVKERLKALEMLGKHHQLFSERVDLTQQGAFEVNITVLDEAKETKANDADGVL